MLKQVGVDASTLIDQNSVSLTATFLKRFQLFFPMTFRLANNSHHSMSVVEESVSEIQEEVQSPTNLVKRPESIVFQPLNNDSLISTKQIRSLKINEDKNNSAITSMAGMLVLNPNANKPIGKREYRFVA